MSYCGKSHCRKCQEGTGHGPYWYAYQTVDGRTTRTYIGKLLPPDVQAAREGAQPPASSAHQNSATIRIYALGQFRLERRSGSAWQTVTDSAWQHQRVRSLLSCLVSSNTRKLGREQLIEALWPELDIETASSRLDRAVYSLRQVFEPTRSKLATSPLLLTEREILVLAAHPLIWTDADAFECLIAQAHESTDLGETERLLEAAATLYGGDFLPEERTLEWALTRRETLQRSWISLLLELADLRIAHEALTGAIDPLDRLLAVDPTNEAATQRLISILAQLGRRGEALRAYKRLASVLQQEYRIAPLPETRALYDAVRVGNSAWGASSKGTEPTRPADGGIRLTPQIGRTHQLPLVGREEELTFLRSLVLATEQAAKIKLPNQKKVSSASFDTLRRPQCILLLGEVGIGKTRLAEEMSREARQRGWVVAWSRVYPQEGTIPYRLWIEVLRKTCTPFLQVGLPSQIAQRPLIYQPLSTLLPELHSVLPETALPSTLSPDQEQLRLWEATRELFSVLSEGTPLLIVLDDLQWADSSSCELLAYLARHIHGHPIIIIGTCRDNELPINSPLRSLLTNLQRERAAEMLQLQPLSDDQISTLVSHLLTTQPTSIVPHIQMRAAGNPFFAEELARSIAAHATSSLPDTITAVLDLRLSRLSSSCRRLLAKAAVLGGSFEFSVIRAMESGPTTHDANEDSVLALLEEALCSGMLTEEGAGTRITYQFWHPLLVTYLYEGLSAARRASLHRRAAEILCQLYSTREEEGAATITHHLVHGGADQHQIAHYAELAGNRAYALSAYPDAEHHYRLAVEHMSTNSAAYLLEPLGECMRVQGKYEEARRCYEQALEARKLAASSADDEQEVQIQAMLWCEIGLTWYDTGNNGQAQQCYERGAQILQEAGVIAGSAWARLRFQQSYVSWREGNYQQARHTAHEALTLFEQALARQQPYTSTLMRRALAGDPVDLGRTHTLLGTIAASGSQCREALIHLNAALALYEEHDREREISIVCCNLGDVHLRKAEHSLAQSFLRRSLRIAERIGDIPLACVVLYNLGVLTARTGDLTEAEKYYRRSITVAEQINDPVFMSSCNNGLIALLQEQGRFTEARVCLHRALTIARTIHIAPCTGVALVSVANVRITQALAASGNKGNPCGEVRRIFLRAKGTLQRVLALEGLEAETRTEGQLALAQVALLLGEVESAHQQALCTLEEAHRLELTCLIARAHRILGSILSVQETRLIASAAEHFEQALRISRGHGMRLEYAHTLQQYGSVLLQQSEDKEYQRGLGYLREAQQVFTDCQAVLAVQTVEGILAHCQQPIV